MALQQWAEQTAEKYEGKISRLLGVPVANYEVRVVASEAMPDGYEGVSGTAQNGVLWLNSDFLSRQNEGLVVHEMTHAFLANAGADRKKVEVLPDWVRWKLGLDTESDGSEWRPSQEVVRFDQNHPDVRQWVDRQRGDTDRGDSQPSGDIVYDPTGEYIIGGGGGD